MKSRDQQTFADLGCASGCGFLDGSRFFGFVRRFSFIAQ